MKKVITYGSFDLFHMGHYRLLERAKKLGDYLIVGVTTEQYDEYRGKINVVDSLMTRIENVKKTGFADQVIIEDHVGQKVEDIEKYNVDIFTVGSDWQGKFEYLRKYCEVVYLERTKNISSTMLRTNKYGIIRLGIIGSGRIAKRFIPEIKYVSGISSSAVFNPNRESAKILAEMNELAVYTDDLEELYAHADAIYIASPHKTHYSYIKDALEHGKHVLCEKPMVLKKKEAEELFALAKQNKLILMEALKTAYAPGFIKLISMARSGNTGKIYDVEACFTKLVNDKSRREFLYEEAGGSFTELGSYPLLAVIKLLGNDIKDIYYTSVFDENGIDIYTKANIYYSDAAASVKVGLGVKSEGNLVVSGTNGYLLAESPWWLTKKFEMCYEDCNNNENFFFKYSGQGLRYEIGAFVSKINGFAKFDKIMQPADSITLAYMMESYLISRENKKVRALK